MNRAFAQCPRTGRVKTALIAQTHRRFKIISPRQGGSAESVLVCQVFALVELNAGHVVLAVALTEVPGFALPHR